MPLGIFEYLHIILIPERVDYALKQWACTRRFNLMLIDEKVSITIRVIALSNQNPRISLQPGLHIREKLFQERHHP